MSTLALRSSGSSSASALRSKALIPTKVSNYVHLRYYQYEVTFGLYMMTPGEKVVFNTILLGILAAIACGLFFGLQPFLVKLVCQMLWYMSGTHGGFEEVCT